MLRKLFGLAAAIALLVTGPVASAQTAPTIEVRAQSVNHLLDKAEYLGEIINQAEAGKQVLGFIQSISDEKKGIEGIDPTRPIGLTAAMTKDVVDSQVLLMIPIADEEAFVGLLSGKLSLDPKKEDGGVYSMDVPNVPAKVFFRFANKYVYVTVLDAKHLDPKKLTDPKGFFEKADDAVASAIIHLDRVPADVGKTILSQFELKATDGKLTKRDGEAEGEFRLRGWRNDRLTEALDLVIAQGKQLQVRLLVNPDKDDLTVEATFTAKPGTQLAKLLKGLDGRTGAAAGLPLPEGGLASGSVKLGLDEPSKKDFRPVLEALIKDVLDKSKDFEKQAAKMTFEAIMPTLTAGELDFALHVSSPNSKGQVSALFAMQVTEGTKIEKLAKQFAPFLPEEQGKFEFDLEKIGAITLHKATVTNADLETLFGTKHVWLGTSDSLFLFSIEPEGKAIREAAKAKSGKVAVAGIAISATQLGSFTEKALSREKLNEIATEALGKDAAKGSDAIALTVVGGDSIKVRMNVKGKAVKFGVLLDQAKKQ